MTLLTATAQYSLLVATEGEQVRAAQRLRHRVFAEELGAVLHTGEPGRDVDTFDAHCDHLVIRDDRTGEVVGTYRMLPPNRAAQAGRLYADGEFDLAGLAPLRPALVETGRSCVHPDHRTGAVINLMWAGIARYLHLSGLRWLAGCASVPLDDGGATAAGVWRLAQARHLAPPAWRVTPRNPWPVDNAAARVPGGPEVNGPGSDGPGSDGPGSDGPGASGPGADGPARVAVPPLLRGYLRLGTWICGPPAHDPDFRCADFFVLLALDRVDPRYLRHFLGEP